MVGDASSYRRGVAPKYGFSFLSDKNLVWRIESRVVMTEIQCVIWDCDGCLIDSEILACSVSTKLLGELGVNISPQDYIDKYAGKGIRHTLELLEQETSKSLISRFPFDRLHEEREELFRSSLKQIEGLEEVLEQIEIPMCIASGSEFNRLYLTLEITNLRSKFQNNIFSSEQVDHGKPAPDIFLFAAEQMNVLPEHCLVIEDSPSGIKAAKAANMSVFGFVGASHASTDWRAKVKKAQPDEILEDIRALPSFLKHS